MSILHKMFLNGLSKNIGKCVLCGINVRNMHVTSRVQGNVNLNHFYDVVISGGGMVGAAMAASLGNEPMMQGKKILLLEGGPKKELSVPPEKYQSRTCALSPATVELLTSFGAWENICNLRYQEVKRMQVWDSCSDALITFNKDDLLENLAYIVENDIILEGIVRQLNKLENEVDIRYNSKIISYDLPNTGGSDESQSDQLTGIKLENGETLVTKVLIGADGFRSLVRKTASIHTVELDYNQFALCATLNISETPENNVAWQRFLTTGPIAMLPLSNLHSCLIWSTTPENAKNLLQLDEENFVDAVNNAFWSDESKDQLASYAGQLLNDVFGAVGFDNSSSRQLPPTVVGITQGSRAMFPLGLCHSSQYVKSRMALIGDAAHRLHPLAGQGVNLGFGDVICLHKHLTNAVSNGIDIGALTHLLKYESERQRAVIPVMATIDSLKRLYSTSFPPIVLARTLGLQTTNAFGPLKNLIMKEAMT